MLKLKRLYLFMLQSFVPLFLMTFFICLFIVLMQFLWRYIDDLVGKGLEMSVIAELFFYAALTMVPMALPLAILLASLMTFGNLGERFELMAMKASGISLLKVMKPLIVLMVFVAIGAFFFQNNVMPVAQAKMYTLLWSMRQKSPELEIPEGVFYDQITGYNILVDKKNRDTGMLYDMMIHDVSNGSDLDRLRIILADSGKMSITEDKTHLMLKLYHGEQFENLRDQSASATKNVPYRRENFDEKEILIPFDNNFNRMDESGMRNQYVGKNISELRHTIDSVGQKVDSVGRKFGTELRDFPYFNLTRYRMEVKDTVDVRVPIPAIDISGKTVENLDSLFARIDPAMEKTIATQALSKARRARQEYEYRGFVSEEDQKTIRRHSIELMKKFTLSIACIIFFFIGAPLGAIIRKGGLGAPLVISVILFIIYYIIDNSGYKLARDGRWEVWQGMWLSTAILLPLGIFLTYKAMNDSAVLNSDAYMNFFRRLFGITEVRHVEMKELSMNEVSVSVSAEKLAALTAHCRSYAAANPASQYYWDFYLKGYDRKALGRLSDELDATVDYIANSRDKLVINKLGDYPILRNLWLYRPTRHKWSAWTAIILFPVGIPLWLIGRRLRRELHQELGKIIRLDSDVEQLLAADNVRTS